MTDVRKALAAGLFAAALLAPGGEAGGDEPPALALTITKRAIPQKFLFEAMHINFAWGYSYRGVLIDRDGRLFRYKISGSTSPWTPSAEGVYTADQLGNKFADREPVGRIDDEALLAMYDRIGRLTGSLKEVRRDCGCRDVGDIQYTAYRYDAEAGTYRAVRLREECGMGHLLKEDPSSDAAAVARWLDELVPHPGIGGKLKPPPKEP